MERQSGLTWHTHPDILCDWSSAPGNRRVLWPDMPDSIRQLGAACDLAKTALHQAKATLDAEWTGYEQNSEKENPALDDAENAFAARVVAHAEAQESLLLAVAHYTDIILRLHAEQCPNCPWEGDSVYPVHA